ncbi:MAG: hypothetical protein QW478_04695 [Candidatus Micrarchaeaceae archaeon]
MTKTKTKKKQKGIILSSVLLIGIGLLIIYTIFGFNIIKQPKLTTISSAQAINMSNSNMKILVAELNNNSYSGRFIVSGIYPILPLAFIWGGRTYELLNSSNLTYGWINEVYRLGWDNNTDTYIKEGLANNDIISAYSSQYGGDRSELTYYSCPNYMRNTIIDALNGGDEMLDALLTAENCYVSSSYYVVGN